MTVRTAPDPSARRPSRTCVCGHVAQHHSKRRSVPQGFMADYKVIWACGWTGCGCPSFVPDESVDPRVFALAEGADERRAASRGVPDDLDALRNKGLS